MTAKANPNALDGDEFPDELRAGTELLHGQYIIEKFLNSGGFGITYLAKDSLDRMVVIKECFPGSFCRRTGTIVNVRSRAHQKEFQSIVKLFIQEAKNLAKLKHPNIVGVHQIFEDNDTAYMALDFIDGRDLLDILDDPNDGLTPAEVQSATRKLLDAVAYVHKAGVLHRDVSPDNILIDSKTGNPVLIDFGAAREEATRQTRLLSAMRVVKDGYSPQEFYIQGSQQSPSSDLYALGATLYHVITDECPPDSQARLAAVAAQKPDPYKALTTSDWPGYDARFLKAINQAMNIFPYDRIQTADEWLKFVAPEPEIVALPTPKASATPSRPSLDRQTADTRTQSAPAAPVPAMLPDGPGNAAPERASSADPFNGLGNSPQPAARKKGGMGGLLAGVAVIALLGAGGGYFMMSGSPEVQVPTPVATTEVAPTAAPQTATDNDTPFVVVEDTQTAPQSPAVVEVTTPQTDDIAVNTPVQSPLAEPTVTQDVAQAPNTALPTGPVEQAAAPATPVQDAELAEISSLFDDAPIVRDAPFIEGIAFGEDVTFVTEEPGAAQTAGTQVLTLDEAASMLANQATTEPQAPAQDPVEEIAKVEISPPKSVFTQAPELQQDVALGTGVPKVITPPNSGEVASNRYFSFLQPDAASEAAPNVDVATAAPLPAPAAQTLEMQSVMSGWTVDVPFTASDANPDMVEMVRADAPAWLQTGTRIRSINGRPVTSVDEIPTMVRATSAITGGDPVTVRVGYQGPDGGPISEARLALQPAHSVALLNGFQFNTVLRDGEWRTLVSASPETDPNGLQAGDRLVAYIPTNERLDREDVLGEIFQRELQNGTSQFAFAVNRNGQLWVASLGYSGAN